MKIMEMRIKSKMNKRMKVMRKMGWGHHVSPGACRA